MKDAKLYTVITPFSDDEVKTKCNPIVKMILSRFSIVGYEFDPKELIKSNKESIEYTCTMDSFRRYHSIALEIGVSSGILKKRDNFAEKEKNLESLFSPLEWQFTKIKCTPWNMEIAEYRYLHILSEIRCSR